MSGTKAAEAAGYDSFAKILHWLVVVFLAIQYVLGWIMPGVHRGTKPDGLIGWHLAVGAFIILLIVVRLIWRLLRPVPLLDDGTPQWQQIAAHATHWLLYLGVILLALLGWANASARGWPITLLEAVPFPSIMPAGSTIGMEAGDVHVFVGWCVLALIGLHVAAALYHRVILRDRVFQRMMPGG